MPDDNQQCNSIFVSALKGMERSMDMTVFQLKVVEDSRSIASETTCPSKTFTRKQSASICCQGC